MDFSEQFYVRRNNINEQPGRGREFEIEKGTYFAFSRARLFVARAFSLPFSPSLFSILVADLAVCLNRVIEYLRPAVALPRYLRACENTPTGETRGREGWPRLSSFRRFYLPFRPAPSSGTCRHATMLAPVIGAPRRGAYSTRSRVSCSQDSLPAQFRPARQPATQTDRIYGVSPKQ